MTTPSTTYAITLYFDPATTNSIRTLTRDLAAITKNDYMIENSVPPHLTLGMFHAEDSKLENLKSLFSDFVNIVKADSEENDFPLSFAGPDNFLDKVIFLKPTDDCRPLLAHLNKLLHKLFLPAFEPADNRNYLPENWVPHVALAVKLNHQAFEKGMEFLKSAQKTISGHCVQIGLARCNPYTQVIDIEL